MFYLNNVFAIVKVVCIILLTHVRFVTLELILLMFAVDRVLLRI